MEFISAHKELILLGLFVISEGLALIPSVKANSIFQLFASAIKGLKAKNEYVPK